MKKLIIKSLPTKDDPCNPINYQKCVKDKINTDIKNIYHCFLPFLPKNGAKTVCTNNVSLAIIKFLTQKLHEDEYGYCKNIKPCNSVVYSLVNPTSHPGAKPGETPNDAKIALTFENTMVEVIQDSYDYTFISIFSEIGGSIGIMIGISCMTIVEFILMVHKRIHGMMNKNH